MATMLLNDSSVFALVFTNLNAYVFGSPVVTSVILLLCTLIFALLIRVPLPVALGLLVPMTLVLMAIGWLPLIAGAVVVVVLVIMAVMSIKASVF